MAYSQYSLCIIYPAIHAITADSLMTFPKLHIISLKKEDDFLLNLLNTTIKTNEILHKCACSLPV